MGKEEQQEEREVLASIFPDEITDVSETEFRISIKLDVSTDDGEEDPEPPTLILSVQYPPTYPDTAPHLDLSFPPNAPKHPHLDIQEDKSRLLSALSETIEENLGMAMIFTLVSTLKDGAELLISERQAAIRAQKEFEAQQAEEEENRKFAGTAVTRETFLAWRERFRREMEEAERRRVEEREAEEKRKRGAKEEVRLTGKQLWERGLVGKVEEGEEEEEEEEEMDGLEGVERLRVEA